MNDLQDLIQSEKKSSVEPLFFQPPPGLSSPHFQTIFPTLLNKGGVEPPTASFFIKLEDGDSLCCKMSTPPTWHAKEKTIVLIHGLGGSDHSSYMVRLSRKFYQVGYRILRVNLRGSGPATHLVQRPYHGGTSQDVLQTILALKQLSPHSPIILIGFSLGGNIALKLVGELGEKADSLLENTIAICAPIDLSQTVQQLHKRSNHLYHRYYLYWLQQLGYRWIGKRTLKSIIDFDHYVTAPQWGYQDAFDYYRQCSSCFFLPHIRHKCHLIFAADDPFVDYRVVSQLSLYHLVKIWLSPYGGHMGFWGWAGKKHGYWWLDRLLLSFVA
jgi:predicted alpha/beta-fold hydrolase